MPISCGQVPGPPIASFSFFLPRFRINSFCTILYAHFFLLLRRLLFSLRRFTFALPNYRRARRPILSPCCFCRKTFAPRHPQRRKSERSSLPRRPAENLFARGTTKTRRDHHSEPSLRGLFHAAQGRTAGRSAGHALRANSRRRFFESHLRATRSILLPLACFSGSEIFRAL